MTRARDLAKFANNQGLSVDSNLNVGIGTTIPRYDLEVGSVGTSATTAYINGDLNSDGIKVSGNLSVTGVSTLGTTNISSGSASLSTLNISGVSTLGTVRISSGIISATSGVVTYYGDGSNLTNLSGLTTTRISNGTSNIDIVNNSTISVTASGQNVLNVTGVGLSMVAGERLDVSSYSETVQTLGSAGSPISGSNALDIGTYSTFVAYVGTSAVTFTLTGAVSGRLSSWTLILIYTNSGARNVSYSFGTLRYPGGSSTVTLSSTQVHDILSFFTADAATNTYASVVGLGFTT